ncbi:MAG: tetratricopeptide repeat protein [Anaerolineales bacterium]|nr:tetratricopeptide repeat protein [Anaerolineales bacterium]
MTTICLHCRFKNPPGMRFCGNCGNRLQDSPGTTPSEGTLPDQLGAMVGADLKERFQQAGLQASGQRRNVTVLFADLSGSTHLAGQIEPETWYEIIQRFISMLAKCVYKYDGMVDKFTGDGLMALFGAPIGHENNAERAIHAAQDMQTGLVELNQELEAQLNLELQMHIGMNSGTVIVGSVGSDMMMDYTAIGETVNMAQRLDAVAGPGGILVSESVYQQTRRLFDFETLPNLQLKGISNPVTAHKFVAEKVQPRSVRGLDRLRVAMVGRDAELQELEGSVQAMISGNTGSFILIRGEAGIGKSRLAAELIANMGTHSTTVLQGRSLTYRRSVPYWMFQDVLRNYLGVATNTPEAQVWEKLSQKVETTLGKDAPDLLPYLAHILSLKPINPGEAERIALLEANQLRQQIFISVRNWLEQEARKHPLLLILDDLHWADEVSLELLQYLLDMVPDTPMVICGITRPFNQGLLAEIEEGVKKRLKGRYVDIWLQSLTPAQSKQLFYQLLDIPDLPESLKTEIIRRADGIPFYLEEILRMLIDDETIYHQDGRWRLNPEAELTPFRVPENLEALILTRFDRLAPECRQLLQVASVIGREFTMLVLSKVLNQAENILQDCLDYLVDRAFIVPHNNESFTGFSFRHVLTSDAIYRTMLKREKGEMHGQIGAAIEDLFPDKVNENVYLLARHYSWSPLLDKALHYLILAGEKASRDNLSAQGRDYFQQALDLLPKIQHDSAQALQVYVGLGDVMVFVGEYERARGNYCQALDFIDLGDDTQLKQFVTLRRKIGTTYERQGDFSSTLEHLDAAQEIVRQKGISLPVELAAVLSDTGWINFRRGEFDLAEKNLSAALELVENSAQYDVIASIYNRLGGVFFQKDELEQASFYVRRGLVLREEIGDTAAVARSYNNLGLLAWKRGDWDEALDDFSRSIELNQKLGDVEAIIVLHNNTGLLQTDKGNLEIARQHLEESLTRSQQIGHTALEGESYLHYSRYWLAAEEWEKSLFYSNRALEIFREIGSQEVFVDLHASMGEAWLGLGDVERAREAGQKAQETLSEHGDPAFPSLGKARILRLMGNIFRVGGRDAAARENLKESIRHFMALKNQLELGRAYSDMATLEREQGNLANARIHAREAHFVFRKLGAKLDVEKIEKISETLH